MLSPFLALLNTSFASTKKADKDVKENKNCNHRAHVHYLHVYCECMYCKCKCRVQQLTKITRIFKSKSRIVKRACYFFFVMMARHLLSIYFTICKINEALTKLKVPLSRASKLYLLHVGQLDTLSKSMRLTIKLTNWESRF